MLAKIRGEIGSTQGWSGGSGDKSLWPDVIAGGGVDEAIGEVVSLGLALSMLTLLLLLAVGSLCGTKNI